MQHGIGLLVKGLDDMKAEKKRKRRKKKKKRLNRRRSGVCFSSMRRADLANDSDEKDKEKSEKEKELAAQKALAGGAGDTLRNDSHLYMFASENEQRERFMEFVRKHLAEASDRSIEHRATIDKMLEGRNLFAKMSNARAVGSEKAKVKNMKGYYRKKYCVMTEDLGLSPKKEARKPPASPMKLPGMWGRAAFGGQAKAKRRAAGGDAQDRRDRDRSHDYELDEANGNVDLSFLRYRSIYDL